jgi:hypothetical protein
MVNDLMTLVADERDAEGRLFIGWYEFRGDATTFKQYVTPELSIDYVYAFRVARNINVMAVYEDITKEYCPECGEENVVHPWCMGNCGHRICGCQCEPGTGEWTNVYSMSGYMEEITQGVLIIVSLDGEITYTPMKVIVAYDWWFDLTLNEESKTFDAKYYSKTPGSDASQYYLQHSWQGYYVENADGSRSFYMETYQPGALWSYFLSQPDKWLCVEQAVTTPMTLRCLEDGSLSGGIILPMRGVALNIEYATVDVNLEYIQEILNYCVLEMIK